MCTRYQATFVIFGWHVVVSNNFLSSSCRLFAATNLIQLSYVVTVITLCYIFITQELRWILLILCFKCCDVEELSVHFIHDEAKKKWRGGRRDVENDDKSCLTKVAAWEEVKKKSSNFSSVSHLYGFSVSFFFSCGMNDDDNFISNIQQLHSMHVQVSEVCSFQLFFSQFNDALTHYLVHSSLNSRLHG